MKYIVYETINKINGMKYRGVHQTNNLEDGYFGSGRKLIEAIEKFGVNNFERKILQFCKSSVEMFEVEKKFVDRDWVDSNLTYNLKTGGHGGWDYLNFNGLNNKRRSNEFYFKFSKLGVVASNKIKCKMMKQRHKDGLVKYDNFTGQHHSLESKRKIGKANSIHQKGEGNSQFGTCWICKDGIAKKIKKELLQEYLDNGYSRGRK